MVRQRRKHVALVESEWLKLNDFASKHGLPMTKAISMMIDSYEKIMKIKRSFYDSTIDIALWYFEKLCFSVQVLKMEKSESQLKRTLKLLEQVKKRYRVDTALLEEVVVAYVREDANVVVVNEALKELGKSIMRRIMLNE